MSSPDDLPPESRPDRDEGRQSQPSHDVTDVAPHRQAIEAIVTEGDDARWQLARTTARAVFREPALVTPRRVALLGEQGLAAFVDEVRSLAAGFIKRERERQASSSTAGTASAGPVTERPATDAPRQPRKLRRPAPLGLVQPEAPSLTEVLKRRLQMSKNAKAFISDAVFASIAAAVAFALGIFVLRFALTLS